MKITVTFFEHVLVITDKEFKKGKEYLNDDEDNDVPFYPQTTPRVEQFERGLGGTGNKIVNSFVDDWQKKSTP